MKTTIFKLELEDIGDNRMNITHEITDDYDLFLATLVVVVLENPDIRDVIYETLEEAEFAMSNKESDDIKTELLDNNGIKFED